MKNYLSLELGGEKRGLKFNIGTLRFIGELTGKDPFEFSFETKPISSLIDGVSIIVHAALLSNCKQAKKNADFEAEDVQGWVEELSMSDLLAITNCYRESMQVSGETNPDTQQQAVVV